MVMVTRSFGRPESVIRYVYIPPISYEVPDLGQKTSRFETLQEGHSNRNKPAYCQATPQPDD